MMNRFGFVLLIFALAPAASRLCAQDFQSQVIASNSTEGWDVTAADFDGDGDVDAAVSYTNSASVSWIENRGLQPSITRQIYQSLTKVRGIAVGDFDGDGDSDIAVADYDDDRFVMLRNAPSGDSIVFTDVSILENCNGAYDIIAVDLNGDAYMDIATSEYIGNTFRVLQSGPGGFTQIFAGSIPNPMGICASDYDFDGDMDFFAASNSGGSQGGLYRIVQTGFQQFSVQHPVSGLYLTSVAAADVDHDSDTDIAVTNYFLDEVQLFRATGSTYTQMTMTGNMPKARSVMFADFNVDGWVDIVAAAESEQFGTGALRWWRNTNSGTSFVGTNLNGTGLTRPRGIDLVDYDLDSDLDVLVVDANDGDLLFFKNLMGTPSYIVGNVSAASGGGPIEGAFVYVVETASFDLTDAGGNYQIETGQGLLTLRVTDPCWNDFSQTNIQAEIGDTFVVDVELHRPNLVLQNSSLNLLVPNHSQMSIPLNFENTGDGLLTISASASGIYPTGNWVLVSPNQRELNPGQSSFFTVSVSIDTTSNGAWDYLGDIQLLSNSCPDTVIHIAVFVQVLDADGNLPSVPRDLTLFPAFPNPFNSSTTISYSLPRASDVHLQLFDVTGRIAAELFHGTQPAGFHQLPVSAGSLTSGVYAVRLTSAESFLTQKILLVR